MKHLQSYLSKLNNPALEQSVLDTAEAVIHNVEINLNTSEQLTALLLGNVQSGKTGQMFGVICKLADEGYKVFIILTTDNVDLQRQTYNRTKQSLQTFTVLTEKDEALFNPQNLAKPIIIVLKKNSSILKKWGNLLAASKLARSLFLCIFDDEADAASLNTLVNSNKRSTINKHLQKIKNTAIGTLYFEVTATPQSIVLQTALSGWKPSFITYFKPGKDYLGGNFFYSDPTSYCIKYTDDNELDDIKEDGDVLCPRGLRESILSFLVVCAYKRIKGESNCNFMIHPSVRVEIHKKFANAVQDYLNLLKCADDDELRELTRDAWCDLQQTKPDLPHHEEIHEHIVEILDKMLLCVIELNSKSIVCRDPNNPDALDLSKGYNIVIGGNTLGRGITFPHLQTVYYCRASKTPQADTFWQHSRIFGYDREKELVRIYIPQSLHHLFVKLSEANNILINQIEQNVDTLQLVYPEGIKPTRSNVLDNKYLNMIVGGVNMYSHQPIPANTQAINSLVEEYQHEEHSNVSSSELIKILSYTESSDSNDFDKNKHISCIVALQQKRPSIQCILIVRTERDISKGTGTLLSPTDRKLGDKFKDAITLTLYRVNGSVEKGWDGEPVWIPNIKYPEGVCFYNTSD